MLAALFGRETAMTQAAATTIEKKAYPYTDATGRVVFEVWYFNRNGRKEVYQRRPSGEADGSWLLSLGAGEFMRPAPDKKIWVPFNAAEFERYPATRQRKVFGTAAPVIPYQLSDLIKAVAAGRVIYVAADEDEAEFIRGFGFVATCCAGGANNWRPEHSAFLQGTNVVLYNGAKIIAQSLAPIAGRLRILDFEGDTVEELVALTAAAENYEPIINPPSEHEKPELKVIAGGKTTPDKREVREFFATVTAQAKAATKHIIEEGKYPGLLQIALVHPADEKISGIYRYELDDPGLIERMTSDAVAGSDSGHNVYIEGRTVRRGVGAKQRGGLEDTIAVFALVVDSDNDKGKAWTPTAP